MAYSIEQEDSQLHERIKAILLPAQDLLRQTSSAPIGLNECINIAYDACVRIAKEQQKIDIDKAKIAYCSACATGLANSKVCRECPCVELGKFIQLLKEE